MKLDHKQDPIGIPRGCTLRIDEGAGVTLYVRTGQLWLTEEGGRADHFLHAGQQFRITRRGATLAHAFRRSVVSVSPAMPAAPAPGIGPALRRFFARLLAPLRGPERFATAPITRIHARPLGSRS